VQRVVKRHPIRGANSGVAQDFLECDPNRLAATFFRKTRPGKVDQGPAHQLSADGEEMGTVLPANTAAINQLEIDLIHQFGSLESGLGMLVPHVAMGLSAELFVHYRQQRIESRFVPITPSHEKVRDFERGWGHRVLSGII
jgi:hypothetical protein